MMKTNAMDGWRALNCKYATQLSFQMNRCAVNILIRGRCYIDDTNRRQQNSGDIAWTIESVACSVNSIHRSYIYNKHIYTQLFDSLTVFFVLLFLEKKTQKD